MLDELDLYYEEKFAKKCKDEKFSAISSILVAFVFIALFALILFGV